MSKIGCLLLTIAIWLGVGGAASAQNTSTFGKITAASATCTPTSCVYYQIPANVPWVVVNLAGTWVGTLNTYVVTDPTATYQNLNTKTWTQVGTAGVNGSTSVATAGALFLIVNAPAWTSGTGLVTETSSPDGSPLVNPVFSGQVNTTGVKASTGGSSTNCWATDGSILSPCGSGSGTVIANYGQPFTNATTVILLPSASQAPSTDNVIQCKDAAGNVIQCAWINDPNTNIVTVSFPLPQSGTVVLNSSGAPGYAAFYFTQDGSYVINNFPYKPYATSSFGQNVFIGTGSMAWGTGTSGALTGNNVAIGPQALSSNIAGGSNTAIGFQSCRALTGTNLTDPNDGNNTCLGADAGFGDAIMFDTVAVGQKAYTDITPGSTGGAGGSVFIGVHTPDGADGWGGSTVVGSYIARYTQGNAGANELAITGGLNTIIGNANINCDFDTSCLASGAQAMVGNTVVGTENLFAELAGFNASYVTILGSNNLVHFNAGTSAAGQVDSNIAVGNGNLNSDTMAVDNVAVGNNLLQFATGGQNTAMGGAGTCVSTTSGVCTAFGYKAASSNTTGETTAFGAFAAQSATDAVDAFGYQAGFNASGPFDAFFGFRAGANVTTGMNIADFGYEAGQNDGSSQNTYIGYGAANTLGGVTTGGNNTCVGYACLNAAGSAITNDVAVGSTATCGSCSNSVMIGVGAVISGSIAAVQIAGGSNSTPNTAAVGTANFLNYSTNTLTPTAILPSVLYSAAGTALPSCTTGIKGEIAVVSDAATPTYMGTYTPSGAITAMVICSGTTWLTH